MRAKTAISFLITILYLGLAAYYLWPSEADFELLDLNEKGDFIAGFISPLAFFWIILGYLQQGDELKRGAPAT